MPSLVRNTTGLLLREDFSAAHGWTSGTGFSLVADPTLIAYPLSTQILQQDRYGGAEFDGVREPQLYIESGVWYLLYDAGDHVTGWRMFLAQSVDRGVSWTKRGPITPYLNGSGGSYIAFANGWLEKRSSTYVLHRGTANQSFAPPDIGLPGDPYGHDIWTATDLFGTWTFVRTFVGTGWANYGNNPCSAFLDAGTYYHFIEGRTSITSYSAGYGTSATPSGAITINGTPFLSSADFAGPRVPENAKVFFHPTLSKYVMLLNLISTDGTHTDRNALCVSGTVTGWAASTKFVTQRSLAPMDTNGNALGVWCHVTGPDGALISELGYVPFAYDTDPRELTPGWHRGRAIRAGMMEPAANKLHYTDATTTRHSYSQTLSHTDFVAEFEVDFSALATGADVSFEYRSNGTTGYRLTIRADAAAPRLLLQTMAGSSIQSNTTGTAVVEAGVMHRLRISCVGTQHDAWIDGERQINVTDATYASGTQVAISAVKVTADVRSLHIRTSNTITIRGLPKGKTVNIRSFGQLPVAQVQSDANGVATYTGTHFPVSRVEVVPFDITPYYAEVYASKLLLLGDAQTSDSLLWGGDDVTIQGG